MSEGQGDLPKPLVKTPFQEKPLVKEKRDPLIEEALRANQADIDRARDAEDARRKWELKEKQRGREQEERRKRGLMNEVRK